MKNLSDILRRLPINGSVRDTLRTFNLSPKVDGKARSVRALAEELGFEVQQTELPKGMTGRLMSDAFAKNGFRIEVNKAHTVEARRFAVLHEIGHYFLHADNSDPFAFDMHFDRSGNTFYLAEDDEKEREASQFAEALLFGDRALEVAYSMHSGNFEQIRRHFGVSENVLRIAMRRYLGR